MAVSKRYYEIVDLLLKSGVDTEMITNTGCCGTALHLAASLGDYQLCSSLLNAGSQPGAVSEEGSSVLHYLAISASDEAVTILKLLLEKYKKKLDLNSIDWEGYTPLMRAASAGDADLVGILLENGADTTIKETNFGKTAFKIAEELAQINVLEVFKNKNIF